MNYKAGYLKQSMTNLDISGWINWLKVALLIKCNIFLIRKFELIWFHVLFILFILICVYGERILITWNCLNLNLMAFQNSFIFLPSCPFKMYVIMTLQFPCLYCLNFEPFWRKILKWFPMAFSMVWNSVFHFLDWLLYKTIKVSPPYYLTLNLQHRSITKD